MTLSGASNALMQSITEVNGSAENIIFWTNYQKELLAGDYQHLKLGFNYGTGKYQQKVLKIPKKVIMQVKL